MSALSALEDQLRFLQDSCLLRVTESPFCITESMLRYLGPGEKESHWSGKQLMTGGSIDEFTKAGMLTNAVLKWKTAHQAKARRVSDRTSIMAWPNEGSRYADHTGCEDRT